ncbi:LysR family transcriptional regulator [Actibacterium mucosum]|nr:LysR family transcriptional regulator [Actibacterium mucosum]
MDWDDLKLFLALVRAGTLREAADIAGVSYSTVGRRVDALEGAAGVALFQRSRSRYHLTQAGEDVLSTAEEIEEQVLALQRRTFGQERALEGPVSISLLDALAVSPFMQALVEFAEAHPLITLDIRVGNNLSDLDRGQADLALRFGEKQRPHLIGRRLTETARAVYCAADYATRLENGAVPGWICFTPRGTPALWKRSTPFPNARDVCYMSHMPAQLQACRMGAGLASLPCFLGDNAPGLRRLTEPDFPAFQSLWLLRHPDTRNNARLRVLSDFLAVRSRGLADTLRGEAGQTLPLATTAIAQGG